MRKSLLKTPHSAPSSTRAPAAALVAVAAPRRPAAKRNGSAAPYTGVPRVRVAVDDGSGEDIGMLSARVRLLEGFVARAEISDCTQLALQWLPEVLGVTRSICLLRPEAEH